MKRVPMKMTLLVARRVGILAGAASLLWLVLTFGLASLFEAAQPEIALRIRQRDPRAEAFLSFTLLTQTAGDRDQASHLARDAARRDATVAVAPLDLALAYEGANPRRAVRLYHYADSLSRREPATQVGLIEDAVRRDDVAGALDHFDAGLSTSPLAWPLMIPVLAQAIDDARLERPIARLIARNRWWSQSALTAMIEQSPNSAHLTDIAVMLPGLGFSARPDITQRLFDRLVREGRMGDAQRLYLAVVPQDKDTLPKGGDFTRVSGFAPYRWMFTEGPDASAERLAPDDAPQNPAVSVHVEHADQPVTLVRQLLSLAPGGHRIQVRLRTASGSGRDIAWYLTCTGAATYLAKLGWPERPSPAWQTESALFHVPEKCGQQWISARTEAGAEQFSGWADDVRIDAQTR